MDPLSDIRKSIMGMAGLGEQKILRTAKVLSTDGDTCCVDIDGLVVSDVRLRAVVNDEESGILVTPKTGSYVTVADLSGNLTQLVVVGFSEVEKISIDAETKIVFNGGHFGGLVRIGDLIDELNSLVKIFNTHTHPVSNGNTSAPTSQASGFSSETLEDDNITH